VALPDCYIFWFSDDRDLKLHIPGYAERIDSLACFLIVIQCTQVNDAQARHTFRGRVRADHPRDYCASHFFPTLLLLHQSVLPQAMVRLHVDARQQSTVQIHSFIAREDQTFMTLMFCKPRKLMSL
jgi:hypothetical protein